MWVESQCQVGDQPVGLRVERLDDDQRERTAAVFAWSTLEALKNAGCGGDAWNAFANQLLSQHVAFSIPVASLERFGTPWWEEALGRALSQFVHHNELAPRINRHLEAIRGIDCRVAQHCPVDSRHDDYDSRRPGSNDVVIKMAGEYILTRLRGISLSEEGLYRFQIQLRGQPVTSVEIPVLATCRAGFAEVQ